MSNASAFQGFQLGAESTAGTAVTAAKRILSLSCEPKLAVKAKTFRPKGQKFSTFGGVNNMWVTASLEGDLDYNAVTYLLASAVKSTTATGTAAPYTWGSYVSEPESADTVKTYTCQVGYTQGIWKWTYGIVTGLKFIFDDNGGKVSADMIGKSISGTIVTTSGSMDAVSATISPIVTLAHHNTLQFTGTYANLGSNAIGYRKFEWELTDKAAAAFFVKGTTDWTDHVEQAPKHTAKMTLEWNSTTSAYLTQFKAGTVVYYKHISTDGTNSLTILGAGVITALETGDEDGIKTVTISLEGIRDANIGSNTYAFKIDLINGINAL